MNMNIHALALAKTDRLARIKVAPHEAIVELEDRLDAIESDLAARVMTAEGRIASAEVAFHSTVAELKVKVARLTVQGAGETVARPLIAAAETVAIWLRNNTAQFARMLHYEFIDADMIACCETADGEGLHRIRETDFLTVVRSFLPYLVRHIIELETIDRDGEAAANVGGARS